MSGAYWMGDEQQSNPNAYGYQQSVPDMNWGEFDYSSVNVPAQSPAAQPQDYYNQYNSYVSPTPATGYQAQGNMFIPTVPATATANACEYENEPPLLEELGINFSHIKEKTLVVLNPVGGTSVDVIADQDLAGPLVFCLLFGAALLLHGKLQFGYVYGIGGLGCVGMYVLMNLMGPESSSISFTCTTSVLGYCLLPMSILSLLTAVLSFKGVIGYGISLLAVAWCSFSASKLFVTALSLDSQRLLVAYPCALLYAVFALLAIF